MIYYEEKGYKKRCYTEKENWSDKKEKNGLIGEERCGGETVI